MRQWDEAQRVFESMTIGALDVSVIQPVMELRWFYEQVRNKGPMDFKQLGPQFQRTGNWNYGALGAKMGYSLEFLQRAAGYAQSRAGTSNPEFGHWLGGAPYGDDPMDQESIRQGYNYYQEYRAELSRASYREQLRSIREIGESLVRGSERPQRQLEHIIR